jgi:putative CocE/NonD family hydrolase
MTLASRFIAWAARLPPADTYEIEVERDLKILMPDGVALLADHYFHRRGGKPPTILVRSPYGRAGIYGIFFAQPFAERGFQVLIQSCRGTFGSGGEFDAFRNERSDGLAILSWMERQPWFSGEFATVGPSYLGFVQWAIADQADPALKAMFPQVTASSFRNPTYGGESFWLDTALTWFHVLVHQEDPPLAALVARARAGSRLRAAFNHLPLCEVDQVAFGRSIPFYHNWLTFNAPQDAWWQPVDFSGAVAKVTAPVHLHAGWYDIFLPETIADYTCLQQAQRNPYLTIGPWTHASPLSMVDSLRESIAWSRAHLLGDRSQLRASPVRIFVMGASEWRDYDAWPPAGFQEQRWHLQASGGLSITPPADSQPDCYRYDPSDPTPGVGGYSLSKNSGPKDNRALEARPDVLLYTSSPLEQDLEAIGPVHAELFIRSSLEYTDFFARLCDVYPSGKSINVTDGLLRLIPGRPAPQSDGCLRVEIELFPTAYRFRRGHSLRLQVSSGAHPRYARNPGSGEPLGTATTLVVADQLVYHDLAHPSAIILPVKT